MPPPPPIMLAVVLVSLAVTMAAASTTPLAGLMKPNPNPNTSLALTNASKLAPAAAAVDALREQWTAPLAGAALSGAVKDVSLFVEPDAGYGPVLDFIGNATASLDYWIYQLADPTLQAALAAAAARGVKVRVILSWQTFPAKSDLWDPNLPGCNFNAGTCGNANYNDNAAVADELRAAGVAAQMSPFWYTYSHAKTMIADGHLPGKGRLLVMDFNGEPSYFTKTRGFGVVSTDALDVAEAQAVFDADWKYELPATYASKHLFWSPNGVGYVPPSTGAARVLGLLASARASLDVYALLIDWPPFADGLAAAARRGVAVRVLTNCWSASTPPYAANCAKRPVGGFTHKYLTQLLAAGVQVRAGPQSSALFVHTKTIVRDAGGGGALATVSSENPGDYVSMSSERELGIFVAKPDVVATIAATFNADWASSTPVTA